MVPSRCHFRCFLRVIKILVFLSITLFLSACVELSPAGAEVRVLKEERSAELSSCQLLGQVSVSSEDALRNATAAMSGDAALMSVRDIGGSLYIRGTVYRCKNAVSSQAVHIPTSVIQQSAPLNETEIARKSAKCQDRGGSWTDNQCVVEIE